MPGSSLARPARADQLPPPLSRPHLSAPSRGVVTASHAARRSLALTPMLRLCAPKDFRTAPTILRHSSCRRRWHPPPHAGTSSLSKTPIDSLSKRSTDCSRLSKNRHHRLCGSYVRPESKTFSRRCARALVTSHFVRPPHPTLRPHFSSATESTQQSRHLLRVHRKDTSAAPAHSQPMSKRAFVDMKSCVCHWSYTTFLPVLLLLQIY